MRENTKSMNNQQARINNLTKRLKNEQRRNRQLGVENSFLNQRSLELGKLKLSPLLKSRTILMCDSANFSDFFGYIDRELLDVKIPIVDFPDIVISNFEVFFISRMHQYSKLELNGELVTLKSIKQHLQYSERKMQTLLSYESKILKFVGEHSNIVKQIALSITEDFGPCLILEYISKVNLSHYLQRVRSINSYFVKDFVFGLADAVSHIHENGILHNFITSESIYLDSKNDPVLTEFSFACRTSSTKCLTIFQQKLFEKSNHLPTAVKNGCIAPSCSSDYYSFGVVLGSLVRKSKDNPNLFSKRLMNLVRPCMALDFFTDIVKFKSKVVDEIKGLAQ